ncbi:hypothetical protein TUM4438_39610 [Shewanella sairae]|uniref:Uncharacterized protein n=1 Tax=Shewanella sairae TaxID=190310 RepID=A0ABQ4PQ47_9GAMM|nr:hypothetical protein TUM4438_39610 [Shewanella sairae]
MTNHTFPMSDTNCRDENYNIALKGYARIGMSFFTQEMATSLPPPKYQTFYCRCWHM